MFISIMNKPTMLFILLIVSIFFFVISQQVSYAISSEYLNTGGFQTDPFSGSFVTNSGFSNWVINDETFDYSSPTNQQISLLGSSDAISIQEPVIDNNTIQEPVIDNNTIQEQVIDNNIYKVWSDNTSGNSEILFAKRYQRWCKLYST